MRKNLKESLSNPQEKFKGALVDVLSMIANKNNLDLVLAKNQVILVGRDIDLTDVAVKELNKVLPKISKN